MPFIILLALAAGFAIVKSASPSGPQHPNLPPGPAPLPPVLPANATLFTTGHEYFFTLRAGLTIDDPSWATFAGPAASAMQSLPDVAQAGMMALLTVLGFSQVTIAADVISGRGSDPTIWRGTGIWGGVTEPIDTVASGGIVAITWISVQDMGMAQATLPPLPGALPGMVSGHVGAGLPSLNYPPPGMHFHPSELLSPFYNNHSLVGAHGGGGGGHGGGGHGGGGHPGHGGGGGVPHFGGIPAHHPPAAPMAGPHAPPPHGMGPHHPHPHPHHFPGGWWGSGSWGWDWSLGWPSWCQPGMVLLADGSCVWPQEVAPGVAYWSLPGSTTTGARAGVPSHQTHPESGHSNIPSHAMRPQYGLETPSYVNPNVVFNPRTFIPMMSHTHSNPYGVAPNIPGHMRPNVPAEMQGAYGMTWGADPARNPFPQPHGPRTSSIESNFNLMSSTFPYAY